MHITTVKARMACIVAFLHFPSEQDLVPLIIYESTIPSNYFFGNIFCEAIRGSHSL